MISASQTDACVPNDTARGPFVSSGSFSRPNEPVLGSSTTRRGRATTMSLRHSSIFLAIALVLAAACAPAGTPGTSGSPGASPSASAGGAATTLVIDRDTSDLISLDPAVLYEFSAVFATH